MEACKGFVTTSGRLAARLQIPLGCLTFKRLLKPFENPKEGFHLGRRPRLISPIVTHFRNQEQGAARSRTICRVPKSHSRQLDGVRTCQGTDTGFLRMRKCSFVSSTACRRANSKLSRKARRKRRSGDLFRQYQRWPIASFR